MAPCMALLFLMFNLADGMGSDDDESVNEFMELILFFPSSSCRMLFIILFYSEYLVISQLSSDLRVDFGNLLHALLIFTFLQFLLILFPFWVIFGTDDEPYVVIAFVLIFQLF